MSGFLCCALAGVVLWVAWLVWLFWVVVSGILGPWLELCLWVVLGPWLELLAATRTKLSYIVQEIAHFV